MTDSQTEETVPHTGGASYVPLPDDEKIMTVTETVDDSQDSTQTQETDETQETETAPADESPKNQIPTSDDTTDTQTATRAKERGNRRSAKHPLIQVLRIMKRQ